MFLSGEFVVVVIKATQSRFLATNSLTSFAKNSHRRDFEGISSRKVFPLFRQNSTVVDNKNGHKDNYELDDNVDIFMMICSVIHSSRFCYVADFCFPYHLLSRPYFQASLLFRIASLQFSTQSVSKIYNKRKTLRYITKNFI